MVAYLHYQKKMIHLIVTGNKYTIYMYVIIMYISLKNISSFHLFHVSKLSFFDFDKNIS